MANAQSALLGIIHGKTIELQQDVGLPDGQAVAVTIQQIPSGQLTPGDGIRRSAGAWAEDADELDQFLEWNRRERKRGRPGVPE